MPITEAYNAKIITCNSKIALPASQRWKKRDHIPFLEFTAAMGFLIVERDNGRLFFDAQMHGQVVYGRLVRQVDFGNTAFCVSRKVPSERAKKFDFDFQREALL